MERAFYKIMDRAIEKYHIEFWDYQEDEMSYNSLNYQDAKHLNYIGAIKFSKKLKQRLFC